MNQGIYYIYHENSYHTYFQSLEYFFDNDYDTSWGYDISSKSIYQDPCFTYRKYDMELKFAEYILSLVELRKQEIKDERSEAIEDDF